VLTEHAQAPSAPQLIKLNKTRSYLTHEKFDHLPDKLIDAETLEAVINT
jgi:RNA polymerase primary sigma factor